MKPNIVFILLDGARWDRINESQEFSELIKQGTLLDNVNTAIPYTIGSVNVTFSGLYGKENGIDASKHLSTQISQKIIDETWLILTMTENHKKQLLTLSPNAIYKTFTLSEYTGFKGDIADPYKKDLATYRETFEAIKKRIEKIK